MQQNKFKKYTRLQIGIRRRSGGTSTNMIYHTTPCTMKVFLVSVASRVPLRWMRVKMKGQAGGKIFKKRSVGFMFPISTLQRDLLQIKITQICFGSDRKSTRLNS